MSPRFEIVRTDAEQPWHARLRSDNGRITLRSENHARKVGAERAVLAAARTFGYLDPEIVENVPGVEWFIRSYDSRRCPLISVLYVDERAAAPRPAGPPRYWLTEEGEEALARSLAEPLR